MGGLELEKLWRGLGRAGSLRPLLINAEHCTSLSSASPSWSWSGKTRVIAEREPHL